MTFSRNFQLGAIVVCVAALASVYLNTRGHRKLNELNAPPPRAAPDAVVPPAIPAGKSLPKSRAEIVAELQRRGYMLQPLDIPPPPPGATGYRVDGLPAGIIFHEREGKLLAVNVAAMKKGPSSNAAAALDFAEIVGEVSTGRSRETCRQAIGQTMATVGKGAGRMSCSFGENGKGFRLETVRHDNGGYSFGFAVEVAARK